MPLDPGPRRSCGGPLDVIDVAGETFTVACTACGDYYVTDNLEGDDDHDAR
jgi:hypothetical protein